MRKILLAAVLVLMASGAQAVTLNVIGGQLHGASNVLVDGGLYDVQFVDGTCPALFSGCDDVSDFTFQTEASANLASQALLDQVLIDASLGAFDSEPHLTHGCELVPTCFVVTPYLDAGAVDAIQNFGTYVYSGLWARNVDNDPLSGVFPQVDSLRSQGCGTCYWGHDDFAEWPGSVLAVWSPIPEPSTALLLGLGLAGLAGYRRR